MRVVAVGDSLCLPRPQEGEDGPVLWDETWPCIMRSHLAANAPTIDVINCGARSRTVDTLHGHDFDEHIVFKRPEIVIIQVGVVDCAPRIFSRNERAVMNSRVFPSVVRDWMIRYRSATRAERTVRNPLAKVWTSPAAFAQHLDSFAQRLGTLPRMPQVLWVPVVGDFSRMDAKSPGFSANVTMYNSIIESGCQRNGIAVADVKLETDAYWSDGYHLNVAGHRRLAEELTPQVARLVATYRREHERVGKALGC